LPVSLFHVNKAASKDSSQTWVYSIDHEQSFLRLSNILVARLFLNEYITTCRTEMVRKPTYEDCIFCYRCICWNSSDYKNGGNIEFRAKIKRTLALFSYFLRFD
jgi:hypothetical protein